MQRRAPPVRASQQEPQSLARQRDGDAPRQTRHLLLKRHTLRRDVSQQQLDAAIQPVHKARDSPQLGVVRPPEDLLELMLDLVYRQPFGEVVNLSAQRRSGKQGA